MTSEFEHIQRIRNDYSNASERMTKGYRNAIEKLSKDLYQKTTHFIFELIQNAEDNTYSDAEPSLTLYLSKLDPTDTPGAEGAFILSNNEVGFSKENIDALCDTGASSKKKQEGYIGEKGIGFKSVFLITSCPYIFSNAYQFRLPERDEETGLGFIVPQWINAKPRSMPDGNTTIILPLDRTEYTYEDIEQKLLSFDPATILFLSKLKRLVIRTDTGFERIIVKDDAKFPLVRIIVTDKKQEAESCTAQEYLIHKKTFPTPQDVKNEERQGITHREIAIACPLDVGNSGSGKLFAYLPVKDHTGLPFFINGDFLLIANREDVHEDEDWNLWLRDCVAEVFVEAFEQWVRTDEYQAEIFSFIPLQANDEFLSPLVKDIQGRLRKLEIVPTVPDSQLTIPSKTQINAPAKLYKLLDGSEHPQSLLQTRLVTRQLLPYSRQLKALGAQSFDPQSVIESLQDGEWVSQHDYEWLLDLYDLLSSKDFANKPLQDCVIVPTSINGETKYSCRTNGRIFLEVSAEHRLLFDGCPEFLALIFRTLAPEFLSLLSQRKDLFEWVQKQLGVSAFSRTTYAQEAADWLRLNHRSVSDEQLIKSTYYLTQFANEIKSTRLPLPVLLANGYREMWSNKDVIVPAALDPGGGWQLIFVSECDRMHFCVLSDDYISDDKQLTEAVLRLLDTKEYPALYQETIEDAYNYESYWNPENKLTECERELVYSARRSSTETKVDEIALYRLQYPSGFQDAPVLAQAILRWLRQRYGNSPKYQIEEDLRISVTYQYYGEKSRHADSDVATVLKHSAWLPTTKGHVRPNEAFLKTPGIKEILGDTVPYFEEHLPSGVIEYLGVNTEVDTEKLVSLLEQHSAKGADSFDLVTRVYRALNARYLAWSTSERIRTGQLIYGGDEHGWVNPQDAIWTDRKDLLGDDFVYLEGLYPSELKSFFVDTMHVKTDADEEIFARRWLRLQDETDREPAEVEKILDTIYRKLISICRQPKGLQPGWWGNFVKQAQIWTQHDTFEDPNTVFVPDDAELRDVCKGFDLAYAWRPRGDSFADWKELYRALGVSYLSESLRCELNEEIEYEWVDKPEFLTDAAKILILAWLYDQQRTQFDSLAEEGVVDVLVGTDEVWATDLHVHYELGDQSTTVPSSCFWNVEECLLLLGDSSDLPMKNRIAHALAQRLMGYQPYKELSTWIELVLGEESEAWRLEERSFRIPPAVKEWQKERKKTDAVSDYEAEANKVSTKTQPPLETSPAIEKPNLNGVSPAPDIAPEHDESHTPEQNDSPTVMHPNPSMPDTKPEFPHRPVKNPARRGDRRRQHVRQQPDKTYERRDRSVRNSANGVEKQTYLREHYTNVDDEMVCQICQEEMPFYKRNGEYYFEAVEALSNITKEDAASYLALCPVCAAKYTEFVKRDEMQWSQVEAQLRAIDSSEQTEIALMLDTASTLRFVEAHLFDLQYLLE